MNLRKFGIISVVLVLFLSAAACDLPFKLPFLGGSDLPEGISIGETYRSEPGGYSLSKVNGYAFEALTGIARMRAPDTKDETGPEITAYGGVSPTTITNQQLLDQLKGSSYAPTISDQKEITVSGVKGLSANIAAKIAGVAVKGQIAVVMFTSNQQFTFIGIAPEKRWDDETSIIFDKVLETVSLFKAVPQATTVPTSAKTAIKTTSANTAVPSATTVKATTAPTTAAKPQIIRQWAKAASASSEYGSSDWSAMQATGAPDTLTCGDHETAWAAEESDSVEWIELTYATPVYPTEIVIYQSYNPSAVTEVVIISTTGEKYTALSTAPKAVTFCPDVYSITLKLNKPVLVNKVRVTIDQSFLLDWTEIDAVELAGTTTYAAQTGVAPTLKPSAALPTLAGQKTATKNNTPNQGFYCTMNKDGKDTWYSSIETDYYSTAAEYILGFNTPDMTQKVTLYLPKVLSQKIYQLINFNPSSPNKAPSAAVFYTPSNYYGRAGTYLIITELVNNAITGVVNFVAEKEGDSSQIVTVVCTFSKVLLK